MTLDMSIDYLKEEGVHEHIGKIIGMVQSEKPADARGLIEVLSRIVKQEQKADGQAAGTGTAEEREAAQAKMRGAQQLDRLPVTEEGEPIVVPCAVPDVVEESEMFAWAGVGLGEAESYRVMCSLRNMAAKLEGGFTKIRFWGKVLGMAADYYVAEAAGEAGDAEEGEDMDPPGSGVNAFTYLVATDLAGSWQRLPHARTRDIVGARGVKRLLTGDPQAKVTTHPAFDGKENVLLRAQIALITADTVICVKGMQVREDPEDPASSIVENAEFAMPQASDLLRLASWAHMQPHILESGRTAHREVPDAEEDPAGCEAVKKEIENDPPRDVLRDLTSDGLGWVVRQMGDTALYQDPLNPSGRPRSSVVTCVRSLDWPGAVCAAQRGSYANLYVGYACRAGGVGFYPPAPPDLQDEPEDLGEALEPQGEEEPAEPQEAEE